MPRVQSEISQRGHRRLEAEATGSDAVSAAARTPLGVGALGVAAYLCAAFQGNALSVGSLVAEHGFHTGVPGLAVLGSAEPITYVFPQLPSGVGVNRFSPRPMITASLTFLTTGSFVQAAAPSFAEAIAGRILGGAGDAGMWVSVLPLARGWCRGHRYALVIGLGSLAGWLGQVAATKPLALALQISGWGTMFVAIAMVTGAAGLVVWLQLIDGAEESGHALPVDEHAQARRWGKIAAS